jgi:hypothetical protein
LAGICTPDAPATTTETFDTLAANTPLVDYPAGVITWSPGAWITSSPWGALTTINLSFANASVSSGTLTFTQPSVFVSMRAYNGGTTSSTITLTCQGNSTQQFTVAAGVTSTLSPTWPSPCGTVGIQSSNGWHTNFDDLVYGGGGPQWTVTPTVHWDQADHTHTDGYRVYWRYPGDTAWRGSMDLPIWPGDSDTAPFYPGIDLDWPIQRLVPATEQLVEVELTVAAYQLTPPLESPVSNVIKICMPGLITLRTR